MAASRRQVTRPR